MLQKKKKVFALQVLCLIDATILLSTFLPQNVESHGFPISSRMFAEDPILVKSHNSNKQKHKEAGSNLFRNFDPPLWNPLPQFRGQGSLKGPQIGNFGETKTTYKKIEQIRSSRKKKTLDNVESFSESANMTESKGIRIEWNLFSYHLRRLSIICEVQPTQQSITFNSLTFRRNGHQWVAITVQWTDFKTYRL